MSEKHPSHKILISACLIGEKVRYDGQHKLVENSTIQNWLKQNLLLPICPEVVGGLNVPRAPAEIQRSRTQSIKILDIKHLDVTAEFIIGAKSALALCKKHQIRIAILTEGSPSCGSSQVNDGHFKGKKIDGEGVTTKLLRQNGIKVFNQHQLQQALDFYQEFNSRN